MYELETGRERDRTEKEEGQRRERGIGRKRVIKSTVLKEQEEGQCAPWIQVFEESMAIASLKAASARQSPVTQSPCYGVK